MPDRTIGVLDVQINGDLADVMQQRRVGDAGWLGAYRQWELLAYPIRGRCSLGRRPVVQPT